MKLKTNLEQEEKKSSKRAFSPVTGVPVVQCGWVLMPLGAVFVEVAVEHP